MQLRRGARTTVGLAALALLTVAPPVVGDAARAADHAAAKSAKRDGACSSRHSRTVERNRHARVYSKYRVVNGSGFRIYRLCAYATGWRRLLGPRSPGDLNGQRLSDFRLRGRLLAYQLVTLPFRSPARHEILIRGALDGRVVRRVEAAPGTRAEGNGAERYGVQRLFLARGGAVGWIVRNPNVSGRPLEVRKSDAEGDVLLDAGAAIEAGSLALNGDVLSWRSGGEDKQATLR